jgi:alpha-galactosidase
MNNSSISESGCDFRAIAFHLERLPDPDGFPPVDSWDSAAPLRFDRDWQGANADPKRATEVRLLWSFEFLFVKFSCRYRSIYIYPDGNCRKDRLWLRDVAEVFIQPETDKIRCYKEFEISPNGGWIDLDIAPGRTDPLGAVVKSRAAIHPELAVWTGEFVLPMNCLTLDFSPDRVWNVNFFRVEGPEPHRFYSAWSPTRTSVPNFHVPDVFGKLQFK